jgi:hypothetical protein
VGAEKCESGTVLALVFLVCVLLVLGVFRILDFCVFRLFGVPRIRVVTFRDLLGRRLGLARENAQLLHQPIKVGSRNHVEHFGAILATGGLGCVHAQPIQLSDLGFDVL